MKRIAIYCPYPHSEAPSQRFRFEQYLDFLKTEGYEIDIYPFLDAKNWRKIYGSGVLTKAIIMLTAWWNRCLSIRKAKKADYVFIHREMAQFGPPVFEWILAKIYKKPFIYDFDDAIWLPNFSESNKRFHWVKWYGKVKHIIKWADQVVVGNDYLKAYSKQYNDKVSIIPTTIDMVNHHNLETDYTVTKPVIGWTGTHTTVYYLDALIPVFKKLEEEFDFELQVISNQAPEFELKSLRFIPWKKETEIEDLVQFSIGIMPLHDDEWAKGKCGFKALQYMSLGIPSVISPVGVNPVIIQDGQNGFLAEDQEAFYQKLKSLLQDHLLRKEVGQKGKETVLNRYSVEANKTNYLQLFQ